MIKKLIKQIATLLPDRLQFELKRMYYRRQVIKDTFKTSEPEYTLLPHLITSGDWVIDIGANVGHYTKRFSDLVGPGGRVLAFEPVPATFALLAGNAQVFANPNVTLINAALSDRLDLSGIVIPQFKSGLTNYYEARISSAANSSLSVLTIPMDLFNLNHSVALVKIDVEDHEFFVLSGMQQLLKNYHPVLIVETGSAKVIEFLSEMGYIANKLPDSPNILFVPNV